MMWVALETAAIVVCMTIIIIFAPGGWKWAAFALLFLVTTSIGRNGKQ